MKRFFAFLSIISIVLFSNSLLHFIYDGIESIHDCSKENENYSFIIYGSILEEINPKETAISNYIIDDLGEFQCSLLKNEQTEDKKRNYKIICSIIVTGIFEMKGYIINEPEIYGFDFMNDKGELTWPKDAAKKTFLMGKCGEKKEINSGPLLLSNLNEYISPINNVRKDIVEKAIASLPLRTSVNLDTMINSMKSAKKSYSLSETETAFMFYRWISQNIEYDCYGRIFTSFRKDG